MLWQLFKTFFLIGAFTFGGGVAMIPIIEKEVVNKNGWLTEEEFLDALAVTQSSPGVLAANMSTYIGHKIRGFPGAVVSCTGAVLPSFLIITIIFTFFMGFRDHPVAEQVFMGIRPAVAALIGSAVFTLARKTRLTWLKVLVIAAVSVLVGWFGLNPILFLVGGGAVSLLYDRIKRGKRENNSD